MMPVAERAVRCAAELRAEGARSPPVPRRGWSHGRNPAILRDVTKRFDEMKALRQQLAERRVMKEAAGSNNASLKSGDARRGNSDMRFGEEPKPSVPMPPSPSPCCRPRRIRGRSRSRSRRRLIFTLASAFSSSHASICSSVIVSNSSMILFSRRSTIQHGREKVRAVCLLQALALNLSWANTLRRRIAAAAAAAMPATG